MLGVRRVPHIGNAIKAGAAEALASLLSRTPRLTSLNLGGTIGASFAFCVFAICPGRRQLILGLLIPVDNRLALSDSAILRSALAGLTNLLVLNLERTRMRSGTEQHRVEPLRTRLV